MRTNCLKAWYLAARPKTLTGATAPVIIALALSYANLHSTANAANNNGLKWIPALLCFAFALIMQIDANLINDYFDYKKGIDNEERLGPARACAQGWITPEAMKLAIIITSILSICVGLPTLYWGGWLMLIIGLACVLFAFLYTTYLSQVGLGDILVFLFFGIIPICTTYYLQTGTITSQVFMLSMAMGLVTDNLLIVNNYRDRDTDEHSGKKTLVVRIGARATEWLYLILGIIGVLFCQVCWKTGQHWGAIFPTLYLIPHIFVWREMVRINRGHQLNKILGKTALLILFFAILLSLGIYLE